MTMHVHTVYKQLRHVLLLVQLHQELYGHVIFYLIRGEQYFIVLYGSVISSRSL